jgi:hypothetical protein
MRAATRATAMAAFISFAMITGVASAGEWRVVKVTGELWVEAPGVLRVALSSPSENVPDGATLVTGVNARVLLSRGSETIVIGPNSVVAIPRQVGAFTTIQQRAGEVDFDVEKQNLQHFAVETPFLAAVVKGTQFTVRVGAGEANVLVTRGLVEVDSLVTGQTADVAPGQSVAVDGNSGRMSAVGDVDIKPGLPRLPSVKPLSSQDLFAMQAAPKAAGPTDAGKPFDVADASGGLIASRIVGGGGGGGGGAGPTAGVTGTGAGRASGAAANGADDVAARTALGSDVGSLTVGASLTVPGAAGVDFFQARRNRGNEEPDVGTLTGIIVAASFAGMALLGIGFAYVRARF